MQSVTRFLKRKLGLKSVIKDRLAAAIKNRDWEAIESLQDLIAKALDKPYNLVLMGDAYKYSHHKFYEDNTSVVYSYMESRGGKFSETVFYGLQMFMKEYIEGVAITQEELDELKKIQSGYQSSTFSFGELYLEKLNLDERSKQVLELEGKLKNEFVALQQAEKTWLNKITEKYGEGNLSLADGTFTPTKK